MKIAITILILLTSPIWIIPVSILAIVLLLVVTAHHAIWGEWL